MEPVSSPIVFKKQNTIGMFLIWHFYEMPLFLLSIWENYVNFVLNYFSIGKLFMTLLAPWRKYNWRYPQAFDLGQYFGVFISNFFSRVMGMLARLVLIIFGILCQITVFIVGALTILLWLLMPVIIIGLVVVIIYV